MTDTFFAEVMRENQNKEKLISEYKLCSVCRKPANGIDDFKNIRSGNIVRSCIRCRAYYRDAQSRVDPIKKKRHYTKDELLTVISEALTKLDIANINTLSDDPEKQKILLSIRSGEFSVVDKRRPHTSSDEEK